MRILQAHNFYQHSGGEDTVVANEKTLLESNGHTVIPYYKYNDSFKNSFRGKAKLMRDTTWSQSTFNEVEALILRTKPDVCHVHNFFPLISPSIYHACQKNKVPVIQTLHNYRLICANGLLYRKGELCEDCLGKSPMKAIAKACYRNSVPQTYFVAKMLDQNNRKETWSTMVDRFICFTDFAKQKFIQHGLPEDKLTVKPNFVPHQEVEEEKEDYLIFVGRLEKEKGVELLMRLAESVKIRIVVVGEGSFSNQLKQYKNINWVGKKTHAETLAYIAKAKALLFPSFWYEGMPMTILEAFSLKTPVIASDLGAMQSIIDHGKNGMLFKNKRVDELVELVKFTFDNEKEMKKIADTAFQEFELKYSISANYYKLLSLYQELVDRKNEGIKNQTLS